LDQKAALSLSAAQNKKTALQGGFFVLDSDFQRMKVFT
jgi:hypothetical protein